MPLALQPATAGMLPPSDSDEDDDDEEEESSEEEEEEVPKKPLKPAVPPTTKPCAPPGSSALSCSCWADHLAALLLPQLAPSLITSSVPGQVHAITTHVCITLLMWGAYTCRKKVEEEVDPEQLRKDLERLEMIKAKRWVQCNEIYICFNRLQGCSDENAQQRPFALHECAPAKLQACEARDLHREACARACMAAFQKRNAAVSRDGYCAGRRTGSSASEMRVSTALRP